MSAQPGEEYARRHARLTKRIASWRRWERWLSGARLLAFGAAAVLTWMAYGLHWVAAAWIAPPAIGFAALLVVHDQFINRRQRAERAAGFYERGRSRLEGHWAGLGDTGLDFRNADHPYSDDLDVFGSGSLFEFLSNTRTRAGRSRLAGWLETPAEPDVIRSRQAGVDELRARLDLREDLAILGEDVENRLDPEALVRWAEKPAVFEPRRGAVFLGAGLATATILFLAGWIFAGTGPLPFVIALLLQSGFAGVWRRRVRDVIQRIDRPVRDLGLLRHLLERLESETFRTPHLENLRRGLEIRGASPSERIAHLDRLQRLLDARLNQFFAPIGALLLWGTQFAFALERWRQENGAAISTWIDSAGELEALASLAGFAYENPEAVFPEIVSDEDGPLLIAEDLGHPLLHAGKNVRNDVELDTETRTLVVSGSNMSGKSTLLRAVGTNLVLAQAGAPVRASRMRISRLCVGASIRLNDSLQEGTSRFYVEILRLRQILDLAEGDRTLVFLLDEILHGTNSHDRQKGADAVIRSLLERGSIGIVTTHDLALARIADEPGLRVTNVHFEDRIIEGRIEFDFRLHPGVITHSNALDLMRTVGLDV